MQALKGHYQLILLVIAVGLLWMTPILLPLRLLVVFFHEFSHAVATWLTGGHVISLTISPLEGGEVVSAGGNRFITLSAGYLGSLLCGVLLFLIALKTNVDRIAMAALGGLTLVIMALYVRTPFALGFCLLTGVSMLLSARYLSILINDLGLRIIGLSSMIYAPLDIVSDTISRAHLNSDARMLATEFGGTTVFWGGLWLLLSLLTIFMCLRYGLGANSNLIQRKNS